MHSHMGRHSEKKEGLSYRQMIQRDDKGGTRGRNIQAEVTSLTMMFSCGSEIHPAGIPTPPAFSPN